MNLFVGWQCCWGFVGTAAEHVTTSSSCRNLCS